MDWRRRLGVHLPPRQIRLHQQPRTLGGQRHHLSTAQPSVAPRALVVALGVRERVGLPGEQRQPVADRLHQHLGPGEPRQVEIAREVLDELLHRDVIAAPERHVIQVLAQDR